MSPFVAVSIGPDGTGFVDPETLATMDVSVVIEIGGRRLRVTGRGEHEGREVLLVEEEPANVPDAAEPGRPPDPPVHPGQEKLT